MPVSLLYLSRACCQTIEVVLVYSIPIAGSVAPKLSRGDAEGIRTTADCSYLIRPKMLKGSRTTCVSQSSGTAIEEKREERGSEVYVYGIGNTWS